MMPLAQSATVRSRRAAYVDILCHRYRVHQRTLTVYQMHAAAVPAHAVHAVHDTAKSREDCPAFNGGVRHHLAGLFRTTFPLAFKYNDQTSDGLPVAICKVGPKRSSITIPSHFFAQPQLQWILQKLTSLLSRT